MIGAAPRPSLRAFLIVNGDKAARCAIRLVAPVGAFGLVIAALPVLVLLKWVGFEDEIDGRYGDGGIDV